MPFNVGDQIRRISPHGGAPGLRVGDVVTVDRMDGYLVHWVGSNGRALLEERFELADRAPPIINEPVDTREVVVYTVFYQYNPREIRSRGFGTEVALEDWVREMHWQIVAKKKIKIRIPTV